MYIAYVDETGDSGLLTKKGASACYALGCVLIQEKNWADTYDRVVDFRRLLRDRLRVNVRWELKANYLIHNGGPLRGMKVPLVPQERRWIYREHLRLLHPLQAEVFGVVVDKQKMGVPSDGYFHVAWQTLLQRLERTMRARNSSILLVHDEGENDAIRKEARKARRYLTAGKRFGAGHFTMSFPQLIDDPVPRNSQHSYMLQLADLVAYSAWRSYMPPGKGVALVAPSSMWNEAGAARLGVVNSGRLPPAIVIRDK